MMLVFLQYQVTDVQVTAIKCVGVAVNVHFVYPVLDQ